MSVAGGGTLLRLSLHEEPERYLAIPPRPGADRPVPVHEGPLLTPTLAVQDGHLGLPLSVSGSGRPFVNLAPDRNTASNRWATPDGRHVVLGTLDGAVHVADLPAIRSKLVGVGMPVW